MVSAKSGRDTANQIGFDRPFFSVSRVRNHPPPFSKKDYCRSTHTVWKFQDFSDTQILREINLEESRSSKTAVFAIFEALNFVIRISKFQPSKRAKIH